MKGLYNICIIFRITLLDHLITYLGKAITVKMKLKGAHGTVSGTGLTMMGDSIKHVPPPLWFLRGKTIKKHAHMVAKLLSDMAEVINSYLLLRFLGRMSTCLICIICIFPFLYKFIE